MSKTYIQKELKLEYTYEANIKEISILPFFFSCLQSQQTKL